MAAGDGARFVDADGRLFGLINVIDALVVLFVLTLVVGGVGLVMTSSNETQESQDRVTRYVTLQAGNVADGVARAIEVDDRITQPNTGEHLRVTDVYRAPRLDGTAVTLRVAVNGTLVDTGNGSEFQFRTQPVRPGAGLDIHTPTYHFFGQISRVDESGQNVSRVETRVTIQSRVAADVADAIAVGDESSVAGTTVGTVEQIEVMPASSLPGREVRLTLDLTALETPGGTRFGAFPIRLGSELWFRTDRYQLRGEVIAVDE